MKKLVPALFSNDDIISVCEVLVMSHYFVMKWLILVQMLIKLVMLEWWSGVIDWTKIKAFKKEIRKWLISAVWYQVRSWNWCDRRQKG